MAEPTSTIDTTVPVAQTQSQPVPESSVPISESPSPRQTAVPVVQKKQLTEEEMAQITAKFKQYDKDGNGTLDITELRALLEETLQRKLSNSLFQSWVNIQFQATDRDYNGVIDFNEFVDLYSKIYINPELPIHLPPKAVTYRPPLETGHNAPKVEKKPELELSEQQRAEAKAAFEKYDADKNGIIDRNELREVLKETIGKRMGETMISRFLDMQMSLHDRDNSGTIDFEEFIQLYAKLFISETKGLPVNAGPAPKGGAGLPIPGMTLRKK